MAEGSSNSRLYIMLGVICIFAIVTFTLSAAGLATAEKILKRININIDSTTTVIAPSVISSELARSITVNQMFTHLNQWQAFANNANNTRAIGTKGFDDTINYISEQLRSQTDFQVKRETLLIQHWELSDVPTFSSTIDGKTTNYNLTSDFLAMQFSASKNASISFIRLTAIPGVGCTDDEWQNVSSTVNGTVALVKRGLCSNIVKAQMAAKYAAAGLLVYNSGNPPDLPDQQRPFDAAIEQRTEYPALYLSHTVGMVLVNASLTTSANVSVSITVNVKNLADHQVGNICADTRTGDPTKTILVGSHSDSVATGPGINDNGSGSAATLVLALQLARLFQTENYKKYPYRVRFCWWGAEELGVLGSEYHLALANLSNATIGNRLQDYLVNLNFDMIGSPNYIFGIYDGKTTPPTTPNRTLQGNIRLSEEFRNYFDKLKLPWNYTDLDGRSDYGPFLAAGIVAGGLFSGADGRKSNYTHDYYEQMLGGAGKSGGVVGEAYDKCYHEKCDSTDNINTFGYEKMAQAAAYMVEFLGTRENLTSWLYPS